MSARVVRRQPGAARRAVDLDDVTAEEVQSLERIASERVWWYWFSPRIEREFQQFARHSNRHTRLLLAVTTAVLFLTVPLWGQLILGSAAAGTLGPIAPQFGATAAFFAIISWLQFRYWQSDLVEWLLLAAFIGEATFIEYLRFASERVGLWIDPSTSMVVPLTVILLGRFRVDRVVLFALGSVTAMMLAAVAWPLHTAIRTESTLLIQAISITGVVLAAISAKIDSRRQWAATWLLQMMAFRDSLTGLPNRRALENHYDTRLRSTGPEGSERILLILIDLDHFKKINDHYGHDYGDGVLAEFAMTLGNHVRDTQDIAARVGGEEFCLLISGFELERVELFLSSIVCATEALGIENESAPQGRLTCSVGAVVGDASAPLSMLYKQADECLYEAKTGGRNTFRWRQLETPR